jgi:hypothetical protein
MKDGRSLTQFSPVAEKMSSEASGLPGKISYGYSGLASTRKSVDIKVKIAYLFQRDRTSNSTTKKER